MEKTKVIFKKTKEKGITLIALVITIIILIILAAVSIRAISGDSSLIGLASKAKDYYEVTEKKEEKELDNIANYIEDTIEGKNRIEPQVIFNGKTVTLTKENVKEYIGKKVTNYTGQGSITVGGQEYTVSTEYRLYYVDFENKYGDGAGTIYLKANTPGSDIISLLQLDTTKSTDEKIKIRNLNPAMYENEMNAPSENNNNIKAVKWLTNTEHWNELADTDMKDNINYIVGAPSIEMLIDSYNTKYSLTENKPSTSATSEQRVKLFYKYDSSKLGYLIAPSHVWENKDWNIEGYSWESTRGIVIHDETIGNMYSGDATTGMGWIASPSGCWVDGKMGEGVFYFGGDSYATIAMNAWNGMYWRLNPLVSLKANTEINIE